MPPVNRFRMGFLKLILLGLTAVLLLILTELSGSASKSINGLVATDEGGSRSSSSIVIAPDGSKLLVVNPDSDSVSIVEFGPPLVIIEVTVGDNPGTVTLDGPQEFAYVSNRGSHSVSVVDLQTRTVTAEIPTAARPYGVLVTHDGKRLYVAEQGADQVSVYDAQTTERLVTYPTRDRPSGLALSPDGSTLYITYLYENYLGILPISEDILFLPLVSKYPNHPLQFNIPPNVSDYTQIINFPPFGPHDIPLFPSSNLLQSVVLDPTGNTAYLPHTRSNSSNQALTVDSTVFPIVSLVDLDTEQHLVGQQFDLASLDPPAVGLPMDAAFLPNNTEIWIANAASNDITVLDLNTRLRAAHIEVGLNPRGIAIHPDGATAYTNNTLAGTVSVIDTATYNLIDTISITTIPLGANLLAGKRLFNDSDDPRLALDQWMSCNTCHFDGEHDGQTWFRAVSGPRNTPGLLGIAGTEPFRWSGEWDELADSEFAIRMDAFGTGLVSGDMNCTISPPDCSNQPPHSGLSTDLDALAAYIDSLMVPLSPSHIRGESLSSTAERGRLLFINPSIGCADCHPAPLYTDGLIHDVGTGTLDEQIGPAFNSPSLLGLYDSPPYFHDGRAETLNELLTNATPNQVHDVSGLLSETEISDLIEFLLALPFE